MNFHDINREKLSAVCPDLLAALTAVRPSEEYELLPARDRGLTLRRASRYLYSSYDPVTEAGRGYAPVAGKYDLVIVAGFGTGHLLEAVLADPGVKAVRVFETDLNLLRLVSDNREIHSILCDRRVKLVWRPENIPRLAEPLDLIAVRSATVLVDPSFSSGGQSVFAENGGLKSLIDSRITELLTIARMGMIWTDNFIANRRFNQGFQPATALGPLIRKNRERVLLAGAGPSLAGLLPGLRKDQDKYLIVAIDTIAKHLEHNGVFPDIIISVDSQPVSRLHLHDFVPKKAVFIFDVLSPVRVFSRFMDRAYFCKSPNPLSDFVGADIPGCLEGLSAANMAIELLHGLGAETVTLAGVDFSFPKNRVYTGGNYFSLYWASRAARTRPLDGFFLAQVMERRTEDAATLSGGAVKTVPVMKRYAEALDAYLFRHPEMKVFSLSGDMISMKNIGIRRSAPAGKADLSGVPKNRAGTKSAAPVDLPSEWTADSLDKYFYFASYSLVYRRFKRKGIALGSDRDWAAGVMARKIRLLSASTGT